MTTKQEFSVEGHAEGEVIEAELGDEIERQETGNAEPNFNPDGVLADARRAITHAEAQIDRNKREIDARRTQTRKLRKEIEIARRTVRALEGRKDT